jgi:hypothetical protein
VGEVPFETKIVFSLRSSHVVIICRNGSVEPFWRVGQYCFYALKMENGSIEPWFWIRFEKKNSATWLKQLASTRWSGVSLSKFSSKKWRALDTPNFSLADVHLD